MRKPRYIRQRGEKPRYMNDEKKMLKLIQLHGMAVPEIIFEGARISFIEPKYTGANIILRVKWAKQSYIPWSFHLLIRGVLYSSLRFLCIYKIL